MGVKREAVVRADDEAVENTRRGASRAEDPQRRTPARAARGRGERGRARTLLAGWGLVGWSVVLAAAVFLGWSGWTVWRDDPAASGPPDGRAAVLRAAERHIAVLNSMDGTRVDAGLRGWLDATTGPLHAQLRRDEAANRRKIGASGTDADATVTGVAVTSLDEAAGKAEVIAAVRVRLTLRGGEPTMQRKRFAAELARTPQGWKLEALASVPVGAR
ncbi:hypothetical protein [Actinomadura sediminis]|uniref:Mce-associated membrane protein n=1 Tax=Actinomadura sediminis TaxID=1038904 RepID=A0ABW3F122_9ACTN